MGTPNVEKVQHGSGTDGPARPYSRSSAVRRLGLPAAALSLALGAAQVAAAMPSQAATPSGRVAVGHAVTLPKGTVSAAAPAGSTSVSLDVQLNTGHAAELAAYAAGVGNRNSPYYHQYLAPSQVAQYFGASSAEIDSVEGVLKGDGLTISSASSDGMFVTASGTIAQAERAFGVTIAGYKIGARSVYANTSAPTLPASIAGDVDNVTGLDTIEYAAPQDTATKYKVKAPASTGTVSSKVSSNYATGSCSSITAYWNAYNSEFGTDLVNGDGYYTDDAISSIYGLNSELSKGDDGAGVTVAVFELENYDPKGVAAIDSCYGHSTSVSEIKVDGGPVDSTPNAYTGVGMESALDIQNIANLAPGVSIRDYAAPNSDAGVVEDYQTIVDQDVAQVISTSWGLCEAEVDSPVITSENTIFEQAAVQGQTVVAASGDDGDSACYNVDQSSALAVQDPASEPYITGVGGTTMTGLTDPAQSTWNAVELENGIYYGGASGGGVSSVETLPSYQSGAIASGYTANCSTAATTGCREVPDVSALADPNNGYVIEAVYNDGVAADTGLYYFIYGGTSGAAPVWAAIFALADASTTCRLNGEAGFVNPDLYTAGEGSSSSSVFTDITTGDNGIADYGQSYGYPATTGYDMSTGWGAPKVAGVIANVCQSGTVSPASYFVPNGPVRLLDTRSGLGGTTGPVKAGASAKLQITGVDSVPSSDVTAVVLNVTAVSPSANGVATVYPDGASVPTASNLNWRAGETEPNLVVVPVGTDGAVDLWNGSNGTVQFLADEAGYFTSDSTASGVSTYTAVGPVRAMDTRNGTGVPEGKIAAGGSVSLPVGGATVGTGTSAITIPSGITAVAMNVTAVDATATGVLTVYPNETSTGTPVTKPTVSNLNFAKNQTVANMVIVPVGEDGKVDFANGGNTGSADAIADIAGYFSAGTAGAKYHALGPVRLLDTRIGEGETSVSPIAGKGTLTLGLPAGYTAVIANLTVVSPTSNGYVSAYPSTGTLPDVSNLNFFTGQTIPNLAIVPSGSGVKFYNAGTGSTQLLMDLAGYFSAS